MMIRPRVDLGIGIYGSDLLEWGTWQVMRLTVLVARLFMKARWRPVPLSLGLLRIVGPGVDICRRLIVFLIYKVI